MKKLIFTFLFVLAVAPCISYGGDLPMIQARVGGGLIFSPNDPTGFAALEHRVDEHLSIGVSALFASEDFNFRETIFFPSLTGRLILPKSVLSGKDSDQGLELYLLTGAGYVRREFEGLIFRDAGFQLGGGLDFWFSKNAFFGLRGAVNMIGSNTDRSFFDTLFNVGVAF